MQVVNREWECQVVMVVLEVLIGVFCSCGIFILKFFGCFVEFCGVFKVVLQRKIVCQDIDEEEEEEDDDQVEYDVMLLEYVGEVIFVLVVVVGGDFFVLFFVGFLLLLVCKIKQGCIVVEKFFVVGILVEIIQGLGVVLVQFVFWLFFVLLSIV